MLMQPSARDKRIRIGAGLVIMALMVPTLVIASDHNRPQPETLIDFSRDGDTVLVQ